jgi:hypothetical protein
MTTKRAFSFLFLSVVSPVLVLADRRDAAADTLGSPRMQPVVETQHRVSVTVEKGSAVLKVRRAFKNSGTTADQAELDITLPPQSAATGLRIKGKEEWYEGDLMEARMAEVVYESLTGFGPWAPRDPALLFWEDLGTLGLMVFPVNPGSESVVEYTLIEALEYRDGAYYLKYPAAVDQPELAVPWMSVESVWSGEKVTINGQRVEPGVYVPIAQKLLPGDETGVYDTYGDDACGDGNEYDDEEYDALDEWSDPYAFCRQAGEALVKVTAPKIATVDARYSTFDLGSGRTVYRLEIDTAKILRPRPKNASVVFVLDGSRSWEQEGIDAALAFCGAFVSHMPDARFEVVVFRRKAQRLFGDFIPASKWKERARKISEETQLLAPGNGSNMEEGLELASSLLEGKKGPARVIVLTDALLKERYSNALSLGALDGLKGSAVVHLVDLRPGSTGDGAEAQRDDGHDLSPVPLAHGGILLRVDGGMAEADFSAAARELVRPHRIDFFRILAGDGEEFLPEEAPPELEEGQGLRYMNIAEGAPTFVKLTGRIWASPFMRIVPVDQDFSEKDLPALIFAGDLYSSLDDTEMLKAAAAGGAVSPVTSYLSIEPGVRPSTEGFDESESGFGAMFGVSAGAAGLGMVGYGTGGGDAMLPDYDGMLRQISKKAAEPCFYESLPEEGIEAWFELTYDEIVDLEVHYNSGEALKQCVEEALWSVALSPVFKEYRYETTISL